MVGPIAVGPRAQARLHRRIELTGPVPRSEVGEHFRWADVLVLPSLCEGSATAVYEALGAGLPVICTPNTGSVVRDGVDGFVVPIRDSDAIADRLDWLARRPRRRREMSIHARQRAAQHTVAHYARRLLRAIQQA
jgi:glycosyltransferase involved in cell wall biosynthesis